MYYEGGPCISLCYEGTSFIANLGVFVLSGLAPLRTTSQQLAIVDVMKDEIPQYLLPAPQVPLLPLVVMQHCSPSTYSLLPKYLLPAPVHCSLRPAPQVSQQVDAFATYIMKDQVRSSSAPDPLTVPALKCLSSVEHDARELARPLGRDSATARKVLASMQARYTPVGLGGIPDCAGLAKAVAGPDALLGRVRGFGELKNFFEQWRTEVEKDYETVKGYLRKGGWDWGNWGIVRPSRNKKWEKALDWTKKALAELSKEDNHIFSAQYKKVGGLGRLLKNSFHTGDAASLRISRTEVRHVW